jgi:hypothetical protein
VPKDITNDFGGFVYRNLEDIEDKVKPFLFEHNLTLTFEDEIIGIEGRVYVKAWAILSDGVDEIRKCAYAREAISPKAKMDDAQLTGSCSSYARKYAAGGLFLIDNTKDADSRDNSIKTPEYKKSPPVVDSFMDEKPKGKFEEPFDSPVTPDQILELREMLENSSYTPAAINNRLKLVKTNQHYNELKDKLEAQG